MNIYVFAKQVPDTEARIRVGSDSKSIVTQDITFMDSPYDEFAVEQAIQLSEKHEGTTTTLVTLGPERAVQLLRDNLAKGIHEAVHIQTDDYGDMDSLSTAKILAAFLKDKGYDLLLFGNKSYGADNAQVPSMLAAMLGIGQVNLVVDMELKDGKVVATRQVEGMSEVVELTLPGCISAQKGLNEPRMKSLKGIMAAKKKEIPVVKVEDLNLSDSDLKPAVTVMNLEPPATKGEGRKIEDEPEAAAKQLADYLAKEIKVL